MVMLQIPAERDEERERERESSVCDSEVMNVTLSSPFTFPQPHPPCHSDGDFTLALMESNLLPVPLCSHQLLALIR